VGGGSAGTSVPHHELEHHKNAHELTKKELEAALAKSEALTKTLQNAEKDVSEHVDMVQRTADAAVAKYKRKAQEAEAAHAATRQLKKSLEDAARDGPAGQVVKLQEQLAELQAHTKQRPYSALVVQQGTDRAVIATLSKQVEELKIQLSASRERPHSAMLDQQNADRTLVAGLQKQVEALQVDLEDHKVLVNTHVQEKIRLIRQLKAGGGGAGGGDASAEEAKELAEAALFSTKSELAQTKIALATAQQQLEDDARRSKNQLMMLQKKIKASASEAAQKQLALAVPADGAPLSPSGSIGIASPVRTSPFKRGGSSFTETIRRVGSFTILAPREFGAKHAQIDGARSPKLTTHLNRDLAALKVQAAARGMLDRKHLWATLKAYAAASSVVSGGDGVFVAVEGTLQGETGWYNSVADHERAVSLQSPSRLTRVNTLKKQGSVVSVDSPEAGGSGKSRKKRVVRLDLNSYNNGRSFYYFVVDGTDYKMLCGPLTYAQYRLVTEDAKKHLRATNGKAPTNKFTIDRVGLLATHRQLEDLVKHAASLTADYRTLEKTHAKFSEMHDKQILKYQKEAETEAIVSENKLQKLREKQKILEEKLFDSERLYFKVLARSQGMASRPSSNQSRREGTVPGAGANSPQLVINKLNDANASFLVNQTMQVRQSPAAMAAVVRIQARIRAFITRFRLRKQRTALAAAASGVMIALGATEQGKSGWYQHGPSFFFFSNYKGSWVKLCGPLSSKQYDVMLLEMTKRLGGNMALGKKAIGTSLLTKCNFDLDGFVNAADGAGLEQARRRSSAVGLDAIGNAASNAGGQTEKPLTRQQILRLFLRTFGSGDTFLSDNQQRMWIAYNAEELLTGKYQKSISREASGKGVGLNLLLRDEKAEIGGSPGTVRNRKVSVPR